MAVSTLFRPRTGGLPFAIWSHYLRTDRWPTTLYVGGWPDFWELADGVEHWMGPVERGRLVEQAPLIVMVYREAPTQLRLTVVCMDNLSQASLATL